MVTFDKESQAIAHKELDKKIHDCDCKPWRKRVDYCEKCQKSIVDFMNRHGAGVLTNDIVIEDLIRDNVKMAKENMSLKKRLEAKIKRVEELKVSAKKEKERIISIINNATMYAGTNNNGIDRKQILKQLNSQSKPNTK